VPASYRGSVSRKFYHRESRSTASFPHPWSAGNIGLPSRRVEGSVTFPLGTLQRNKRSRELAFVIAENTLKYFSMMRYGRSRALRQTVILFHLS
jgi:hypothetical protein